MSITYDEARRKLVKAGKSKEASEIIQRWVNKANAAYDEIRSDSTISEEYRLKSLAVVSIQHRRALEDEIISLAERTVLTDRDDAQKVFGIAGIPGDQATLVISRRDAGDRVATIARGEELRELLARATRTGDEVMARAIAERALEMGSADTLNQFTADRPEMDSAVERLWNMERRRGDAMALTVAMVGMKPAELEGRSLEAVANG
ncbi:hypothetical protein [Nocardioides sp. AE5]|uniref:hypothetical protein n=1 Tax=Nocardioides sp. AE5 TaxID=2962573 RepID=UPI0028810E20|nr:hypothetical protein [Nocardioides sp. AE5]MDT0201349.1 hypothetical protein [Nocardioides sp. AE5]